MAMLLASMLVGCAKTTGKDTEAAKADAPKVTEAATETGGGGSGEIGPVAESTKESLCPECGSVVKSILGICEACGYDPTVKTDAPEGSYIVRVMINPDIIFLVGADDEVMAVLPQNKDAEYVYLTIELSGSKINDILKDWVSECSRAGYDVGDTKILVSGAEGESSVQPEKLEKIEKAYTEVCGELNITPAPEAVNALTAENKAEEIAPENIGVPVCPGCGIPILSLLNRCEECGYDKTPELYRCFCGSIMDPEAELCHVCHLNNKTGQYEDGWGPEGKITEIKCFCGATLNSDNEYCPECHLNNKTGQYEQGWGPNGRIEEVRCVCGAELVPGAEYCTECHLNNITGEYEEGWGPDGEIDTQLHCIYCDSVNVYIGRRKCGNCGGTGLMPCFQCGGSGTDYVTAADDSSGWYETCSNCHGSGMWTCQHCKKHPLPEIYICSDCDGDWSIEEE